MVSSNACYLKCKIDCALFEDQGRIGMGMVLRDHQGGFLAAKAKNAYSLMDALVVEALSCRSTLQCLRTNNYRNVLLEADSLLLASVVNNSTPYFSPIGLIIQDCKALIQVIPSISFVRQSANHAAHLLARAAGSTTGYGEWVHYPPTSILVVISVELFY